MTMEETPKKKKKAAYKVVAIEFSSAQEKGKPRASKVGTLKRVAKELEKHMRNFKRWGYDFRIHEYSQGLLVVGERQEEEETPPGRAFPFIFAPFQRPPDPMAVELAQVNPAHIETLNRVLIGMDNLPPNEQPTGLPKVVAEVTRGMPGERIREIIAAGEKFAEVHEKHQPDPNCSLLLRVRKVLDTLRQQVQLQTS